jgi:hypothetical protein
VTVLAGSCLCGARAYEIDGDVGGVWIFHCSLCRKASGSSGNAILVVPRKQFRRVKGQDHGVTLRKTYTITRCKTCGALLPAESDERNVYVTAGTLDSPLGEGVRTGTFCASRADWDGDDPDVRGFDERAV